MKQKSIITVLIAVLALMLSLAPAGCNSVTPEDKPVGAVPETSPPAATDPPLFELPDIPVPTAPGRTTVENSKAVIDYSNMGDGYIMAKFRVDTGKDIRAMVITPDGTRYQYRLIPGGDYSVLPLSGGNGEYTFSLWEHVEDSKYAQVLTVTVVVELDDEFAPFLRPNQFVNFDKNSEAVRKAAELSADTDDLIDIITKIYDFVVENISYDRELAATVQSGYLPDVDAVLKTGKGICFDYAALMTAMLRSRGIPTKMVFGYTGEEYHAWISVYTLETGWISDIIQFDGISWNIMDPTFAASGQGSDIIDYITDSSNYAARFLY